MRFLGSGIILVIPHQLATSPTPSAKAMRSYVVTMMILLSVCLCEAFLPGISSKWVRNVASAKQHAGWEKLTPLFLTTADFKNGMTIELGMWKNVVEYYFHID